MVTAWLRAKRTLRTLLALCECRGLVPLLAALLLPLLLLLPPAAL